MNKKDYLNLLRYYLRDLPELVVDDIVYDYEEHFSIGMSQGKTEEQISEELGFPDDIAKEYLGRDPHKAKYKSKVDEFETDQEESSDLKSNFPFKIITIFMLVLFAPAIFGLVIGIIGLIFGLFAGIIGAGIGLISGAFAVIASIFGIGGSFISMPQISIITKIFLAIALGSFGLLCFKGAVSFVKMAIKSVKDLYISIRWKLER